MAKNIEDEKYSALMKRLVNLNIHLSRIEHLLEEWYEEEQAKHRRESSRKPYKRSGYW